MLPTFIVIGTPRGGTTSLWKYLIAHPDIPASWFGSKEVHFFDWNYARGTNWYRSFFPTERYMARHKRRYGVPAAVGEASPGYLAHPSVANRVEQLLPTVRLVAVLRNPIERAYSRYQQYCNKGMEQRPFEKAVAEELSTLRQEDAPGQYYLTPPRVAPVPGQHFGYLWEGMYALHLQRWLDIFPRDRLLVIRSEDLYSSPERVVAEVQTFLGLRPWHLSTYKTFHASGAVAVPKAIRGDLIDFFRPVNLDLYFLLEQRLWWDDWGIPPTLPGTVQA